MFSPSFLFEQEQLDRYYIRNAPRHDLFANVVAMIAGGSRWRWLGRLIENQGGRYLRKRDAKRMKVDKHQINQDGRRSESRRRGKAVRVTHVIVPSGEYSEAQFCLAMHRRLMCDASLVKQEFFHRTILYGRALQPLECEDLPCLCLRCQFVVSSML